MSKVIDRFLKYAKYDTKSDEESTSTPSTEKQLVLGNALVEELKNMGIEDASIDENGYVMGTLKSNMDKDIPTIGFIAHMDTCPEISDTNVKPQLVENYDGKDIILNKEKNIVLSPSEFPELNNYLGKTLITTDGNTLLGADDKAGIAEIVTAVEYLINHPEIKHGDIRVGFTPDEEVGRGADHFDVKKFNAKYAYTLDGGEIGELQYENFNAASVKIEIQGKNVHTGSAKDVMINSALIGTEIIDMLPKMETPEHTENYEGFYHLCSFNGEVEETKLSFILRDHNKEIFEQRKANMQKIVDELNKKYNNRIKIEIKDQYYNMKEKIEPVKEVVDIAYKAMEDVGVVPKVQPIRGGTDGARLSYEGLPTPNLFTGGHNFHGKHEYIPTFAMEKAVEVILKIIEIYSNR